MRDGPTVRGSTRRRHLGPPRVFSPQTLHTHIHTQKEEKSAKIGSCCKQRGNELDPFE